MMRIIGIDLATTAKHRAIVVNERSRFISPLIKFDTRLADLRSLCFFAMTILQALQALFSNLDNRLRLCYNRFGCGGLQSEIRRQRCVGLSASALARHRSLA
jgi:hypothetical protein